MKKIILLCLAVTGIILLSACKSQNEERITAREPLRESLYTAVLAHAPEENFSYWYECDYYGNCWDSEKYSWYDCYYNSKSKSCDKGSYWKIFKDKAEEKKEEYREECDSYGNCIDSEGYKWYNAEKDTRPLPEDDIIAELGYPKLCCDSWGKCYNENGDPYDDPTYLVTNYCDQCGGCYDYYGNYVKYDESAVNEEQCEQADNYDIVSEWDVCGNAYDKAGNFLFYDNFYYDFQACNGYSEDYCVDGYGGPDLDLDLSGPDSADYCDECGNCYDYYGNELGFDETYYDEYWCSQYYQYDKVWEWDDCGNAYDKDGTFLFYDNEHYDYKKCYETDSADSPRVYPKVPPVI